MGRKSFAFLILFLFWVNVDKVKQAFLLIKKLLIICSLLMAGVSYPFSKWQIQVRWRQNIWSVCPWSFVGCDLWSPVIYDLQWFVVLRSLISLNFLWSQIFDLHRFPILRSLRRIFDLDESPVLLKSDLDLLQIFRSWSSTSEKSSIFYVLKRSLDLQFWSFRSKI